MIDSDIAYNATRAALEIIDKYGPDPKPYGSNSPLGDGLAFKIDHLIREALETHHAKERQ